MTEPSDTAGTDRPIVLFVDDEPDVLAGVRTALRRERKRLDLRFAESGAEALEEIAIEDVAVVVSDMRMPQMTGAELLERVWEQSPQTVRLVLTGEAEAELVMRAIHVTHQWLSKPADRDTLLRAIDAGLRYRALLVDPTIRAAVARIGSLPSPPEHYLRLTELIRSPTASADAIAAEISTDPAAAAKILQLANSAFSAGTPVTDLTAAVTRIGLENVAYIVLSAEMYRPWADDHIIPGCEIDTLAAISEHAAGLARRLVSAPERAPAAALGALLHGVGLIVQAQEGRDDLHADHSRALEDGTTLAEAQVASLGVSYAHLGAHLLSMWGLPTEAVLAVETSLDHPLAHVDDLDVGEAVRLGVHAAHHAFADQVAPPLRLPMSPEVVEIVESLAPEGVPT